MKRLLGLLLLFFSAASFAQDKFIEVEVADTITLRPERFEYEIKVYILDTSAVMVEEIPYDIKAEKAKYAKQEAELVKMLKKHKHDFKPIPTTASDGGNMAFYNTTGAVVVLKNEKEFLEVQKLMEKIDYVYGSFGEVHYANEQKAEEALYEKLLGKAAAKAAAVAAASGLKAGRVIAVREAKDMSGLSVNIGDTYYVGAENKNLALRDGGLEASLYKKLVVRFAAE